MNMNEPVAWINKTGSHGYLGWDKDDKVDESIPLYTHPVKEEHFEDEPQAEELHEILQSNAELTDEEIIWVYQNLWQFLPSEEPDLAKDIKKFARALLRKAQEK